MTETPRIHRPDWPDYFIEIVQLVATRSTCIRRQVGAILVLDKRILSTGYNGAPQGLAHCLDIGCMRDKLKIPSGQRHELCRALHAEQNAIIQAATSGTNIQGSDLYCTHFPCSLCMKMLINSGVQKIYYIEGYPDELSKEFAEEAKLELIQIKKSTS